MSAQTESCRSRRAKGMNGQVAIQTVPNDLMASGKKARYSQRMDDIQQKIAQIFMPHGLREMDRARKAAMRFVHYTSADTGLKILHSQEMLLRNSSLMNDFSEVRHGFDCLVAAYNGDVGARLKAALRQVQEDLPEVLESNFNSQVLDIMNHTYLLSVSEHEGEHEDRFGRLSMWRAYAPKDGIAFVMKSAPFLCESDSLQAFSSPVSYTTQEAFQPTFEEVVTSIESNIDFLKNMGGNAVHEMLMVAFRFAAQSTKHPAFKEEKEWRVIYTPTILEARGAMTPRQAERIPTRIMSLNGVPQRVYAIPFRDYPDEGFIGAAVPDLIDRILIGPSTDAHMIAQAFVSELQRLDVQDAHLKVTITGVPLRHG